MTEHVKQSLDNSLAGRSIGFLKCPFNNCGTIYESYTFCRQLELIKKKVNKVRSAIKEENDKDTSIQDLLNDTDHYARNHNLYPENEENKCPIPSHFCNYKIPQNNNVISWPAHLKVT